MPSRLFLIHWNEAEAKELAEPLLAAGWQVEWEAEDGARASRRVLAEPPAVVVIYLTRLPSHGRETARYLRSRHGGRNLPFVFVGDPERAERVRPHVPDAEYVAHEELMATLASILSQSPGQGTSHD